MHAIGIQLNGRLGNQMFQYAVARTLAERLDCRLVIAGKRRHWEPNILELLINRTTGRATDWHELGILRQAVGLGPGVALGRTLQLLRRPLRSTCFRRTFSPRRFEVGGLRWETFDEAYFDLRPGTWLNGFFQSERYFASEAER